MSHWRTHPASIVALSFVVYSCLAQLGALLFIRSGVLGPVWALAGFGLGIYLILGRYSLVGIFLGSLLSHLLLALGGFELLTSSLAADSTIISLGLVLQLIVSRELIHRFCTPPVQLTSVVVICRFLFLAGPAGCLIGSLIDAAWFFLTQDQSLSQAVTRWFSTWIGNSLGVMYFTPISLLLIKNNVFDSVPDRWKVLIPAIVLFVLVRTAFTISTAQFKNEKQTEFNNNTSAFLAELALTENISSELLHAISGLYRSTTSTLPVDFRTFLDDVQPRDIFWRSINWAPYIPYRNLNHFLKLAKEQVHPLYKIKTLNEDDGDAVAAPRQDYYLPILNVYPMEENRAALGLDLSSHPTVASTVEQAIASGEAMATPPFTLIQASGNNTGVSVYYPVYRQNHSFPKGEGKPSDLMGIANIAFEVDKLVQFIHSKTNGEQYGFRLVFDGQEMKRKNSEGSEYRSDALFVRTVEAQFFGRKFQVFFSSSEKFDQFSLSRFGWAVYILIFVSGLIGIVFLLVITSLNQQLKRQVETLETSDHLLQEAQKRAHMGSFEWHASPRSFSCSEELYRIWEADPQSAIDRKTWWSRIHPDDLDRVSAAFTRALSGESLAPMEFRILVPSGAEKTVHFEAVLITGTNGQLIRTHGSIADITERKAYEEELISARVAAESANEAKSTFLAMISHEIRTPVNAILGMLDLTFKTELSSQQQKYLKSGQQSAELLSRIINDILDYSKIEAAELILESIPFNLYTVMDEVSNTLALKADMKQLELIFEIDPQLPTNLIGDPTRLTQVLVNLGDNAIKFTRSGEITLSVISLRSSAGQVSLQFTVRDTGIGIDPAKHASLFQPFTQADSSISRRFGGTGLGLVISNRLVAMMGSDITVDSELNAGSRFQFLVSFSYATGPGASSFTLSPKLVGKRILLVDDNRAALESLAATLDLLGFDTVLGGSGRDAAKALNTALQNEQNFDLALIDWSAREPDGSRAVEWLIGEFHERTPAIIPMVGAADSEDPLESSARFQIRDVLHKPLMLPSLLRAICGALDMAELANDAAFTTALPPPPSGQGLEGLRILLVEDDAINQAVAVELLSLAGMLVINADNGLEALEILETTHIDCGLMDIQRPGMDGFEISQRIRKQDRFKHMPIIGMTAGTSMGGRERALAVGMNDLIIKPFVFRKLLASIAEFTGRSEERRVGKECRSRWSPYH